MRGKSILIETISTQILGHDFIGYTGKSKFVLCVGHEGKSVSGDVLHAFLAAQIEGQEGSVSRPGRFTPRGKRRSVCYIGCLVCSKTDLASMEKYLAPAAN